MAYVRARYGLRTAKMRNTSLQLGTQRVMLLSYLALAFAFVLFALPLAADAQQLTRVPRIGIISPLDRSSGTPDIDAFKQGLRELGYVEGRNIAFEYRSEDAAKAGVVQAAHRAALLLLLYAE